MPYLVSQGTCENVFAIAFPECVIGRGSGCCEVVVDSSTVSSQHALISFDHFEYFIADLDSRNGTFLNSERLTQPRILGDGDFVHFGDAGFRFYLQRPELEDSRIAIGRSDENQTPSFRPTASWTQLQQRANLLEELRQFFREREFLEVETPLLSADTVIERYTDPIRVTHFDQQHAQASDGGVVDWTMWLQTSPEFCMKRLLAAGGDAIFQVAKAFRGGEQGTLHNIEFTIAEWYRVGDTMEDGMNLLDELCVAMLDRGPAERLSYAEVFERYAKVEPHRAEDQALRDVLRQCKDQFDDLNSIDRDGLLNLILVEFVEPHLGIDRPTVLFDYPASQAALAKVRNNDPPVAERFELYVDGIELANGYHELLDADVLRKRNAVMNGLRIEDGRGKLPEKSRLLDAMEHGLPSCSGVALGFDRLVMVATGAKKISEVIAFPSSRA